MILRHNIISACAKQLETCMNLEDRARIKEHQLDQTPISGHWMHCNSAEHPVHR